MHRAPACRLSPAASRLQGLQDLWRDHEASAIGLILENTADLLIPEPVVAVGADIRVQSMRRHVRSCVRVVTVPVSAKLARRPRSGVGAGNGEGQAFLHGGDRIHAPSANHLVEQRIHGVAPLSRP